MEHSAPIGRRIRSAQLTFLDALNELPLEDVRQHLIDLANYVEIRAYELKTTTAYPDPAFCEFDRD